MANVQPIREGAKAPDHNRADYELALARAQVALLASMLEENDDKSLSAAVHRHLGGEPDMLFNVVLSTLDHLRRVEVALHPEAQS